MSQLEKAVSDYIKDNGTLKEKAEEGGVSLGFLSNYIVANIDEIFASEIVNAAETGELHCEDCDAYYNYNEAVISDAGELTCPDCGGSLTSASCSICGTHLYLYKEGYIGKIYKGKICCPECVKRLTWVDNGNQTVER